MITRVEKITIFVNSQEEAQKFWLEQVGFVVTLELPMGPSITWLEVAPAVDHLTSLVLYDKQSMQQQHPEFVQHPNIIFATDDADAEWARLKANGVEVTDVNTFPYGKMFSFKDNDGNVYMVRG